MQSIPFALGLTLLLGGDTPTLPRDTLPPVLELAPPYGVTGEGLAAPTAIDPERAAIGRRLFFDPILSVDRTVACASCHQPEHGFADAAPTSAGVHGRRTTRNAPSLFNKGLGRSFMWDGRAPSLVEQVLLPIENPDEMGLALDEALRRVGQDAEYAERFRAVYGAPPAKDTLAQSLAAFVGVLWHGDTPVDHFQAGEAAALTEEERTGLWIYESKGGCWRCHSGPNFTDEELHNTGVGVKDGAADPGRAAITKDPADTGAFKTPTLRGVALNAPYMHDGSLATLKDVVEFYRRGGNQNPHLDEELAPLDLTEVEATRLVLFLEVLSRSAGEQARRATAPR